MQRRTRAIASVRFAPSVTSLKSLTGRLRFRNGARLAYDVIVACPAACTSDLRPDAHAALKRCANRCEHTIYKVHPAGAAQAAHGSIVESQRLLRRAPARALQHASRDVCAHPSGMGGAALRVAFVPVPPRGPNVTAPSSALWPAQVRKFGGPSRFCGQVSFQITCAPAPSAAPTAPRLGEPTRPACGLHHWAETLPHLHRDLGSPQGTLPRWTGPTLPRSWTHRNRTRARNTIPRRPPARCARQYSARALARCNGTSQSTHRREGGRGIRLVGAAGMCALSPVRRRRLG
jgi:hypothetical protein